MFFSPIGTVKQLMISENHIKKNNYESTKLSRNSSVHKHDIITKCATILKRYPSRPSLAAATISGQHIYSSSSIVPFSRSLLWKTALLKIETIGRVNTNDIPLLDLSPLRDCRESYTSLVENIGIPWHSLPKNSVYYKSVEESDIGDIGGDLSDLSLGKAIYNKQKMKKESVPLKNSPLFDETPQNKKDADMLTVIIADVERLFPEFPEMFIENHENKVMMIEILYRYAKSSDSTRKEQGKKELSYLQGMHELCGVIFAVLNVEAIDFDVSPSEGFITNTEHDKKFKSQIQELFHRKYLSQDLFSMFDKLMSPIVDKYFTSSGILKESIIFDLKLHHLDPGTPSHPGLSTVLKDSDIESQLWLTRWFRMILTREVGLAYAVRIWDGLIAYACVGAISDTVDSGNDVSVLLPSVILLLVLRIRSQILKVSVPCLRSVFDPNFEDDSEALSLLLHYPTSEKSLHRSLISPSTSFDSDTQDDEPVMMHRRINSTDSQTQRLITNATKLPKMPSVIELFTDAASICGLSDTELNAVGSTMIMKYSGGDIYDCLKQIKKSNKSSTNFFDSMMKKTQSWTTSKSSENSIPALSSVEIDNSRSRLEMRLQKKVHSQLNN